MDLLKQIISIALLPSEYFRQSGNQYYWLTYVVAALFGLLVYLVTKRRFRLSLKRATAMLFPPRMIEHQSTKLDFKLMFVSIYYLALQVITIGGTTLLTIAGVVKILTQVFGTSAFVLVAPSWFVTLGCMAGVFLAIEFGYWLSHYLMHKIPFLWEFHKVHHSAEVLTPLTEWRQHPVELYIFPALIGLAACLVQAPFVYLFGEKSFVIDPLSSNFISMAFWYTFLHLRHTELPIYATGFLGKIIQAPAHHQVHHSTNPKHFDTNLGYCLSIFDWMFGTLYVPKKGEKFEFGLGHQDDALETVVGSIVAPITRVAQMAINAARAKVNAPQ